ncbi:MAG TPA: TolC family protein [Paludibaculum sp.]
MRYLGMLAALWAAPVWAQVTLDDVVRRAGERYAGVQVSIEQASLAAAAVQQARLAYLPRGDFYAQANLATRNNVYGMLMPNRVIAPISGPPSATNAGTNVFGTAVGFLINWEPLDMGQRKAHIATMDAGQKRAVWGVARTRLEVEATAADAFLTCLAADETVARARAGVERAASLEKIVEAQTKAGLRPEADLARARAERVLSEAQVIQAEHAARLGRIAVAQYAGGTWQDVRPVAPFVSRPANLPDPGGAVSLHPALQEQSAAVNEAELRRHEALIAWRPRFQTDTALFARGIDAGPNIYNWGIGLSVLFPVLDLPQIRAKRQEEMHRTQGETARLRKLTTDLDAEMERARAGLDTAIRMAATTPPQLEAARAAQSQAVARYQAGLANMVDVADTQRLLLQAEIDDGLAKLNVWRAHLGVAIAAGDLGPFLERTKR